MVWKLRGGGGGRYLSADSVTLTACYYLVIMTQWPASLCFLCVSLLRIILLALDTAIIASWIVPEESHHSERN